MAAFGLFFCVSCTTGATAEVEPYGDRATLRTAAVCSGILMGLSQLATKNPPPEWTAQDHDQWVELYVANANRLNGFALDHAPAAGMTTEDVLYDFVHGVELIKPLFKRDPSAAHQDGVELSVPCFVLSDIVEQEPTDDRRAVADGMVEIMSPLLPP